MKRKISALAAALLLAGCATAGEQECIAWSDDCESAAAEPAWEATVYYEGDRETETESHAKGRSGRSIGEQTCRRQTTPWRPEKVQRVELTRVSDSKTISIDCNEVRS